MLSHDEILKKVKEREDKNNYVGRFIAVYICPYCGGDINMIDGSHPFMTQCKCGECHKIYTTTD